ncbi:MAG: 4-(cytidine 5'-diphospho)-2-C-methyl-D-erythritol kinase [Acidobacteriota bacterium]
MRSISLRAFAKINLGLEVLGMRKDGYHEIKTIFQSVNLWDSIYIEEIEKGIYLAGNSQKIPWDRSNLIFKACEIFLDTFRIKKGVRIYIKKRIPPGKGLGGGSSNAASVLVGLKKMWGIPGDNSILLPISKSLGADVPYFLCGGTALGTGTGASITPLEDIKNLWAFLIFPDICLSTSFVYSNLLLTFQTKESNINRFLRNKDLSSLENDLEKVSLEIHPDLKYIKKFLKEEGAKLVLMSGSGSSIFGIFKEYSEAKKTAKKIENMDFKIAKFIERKYYWKYLWN